MNNSVTQHLLTKWTSPKKDPGDSLVSFDLKSDISILSAQTDIATPKIRTYHTQPIMQNLHLSTALCLIKLSLHPLRFSNSMLVPVALWFDEIHTLTPVLQPFSNTTHGKAFLLSPRKGTNFLRQRLLLPALFAQISEDTNHASSSRGLAPYLTFSSLKSIGPIAKYRRAFLLHSNALVSRLHSQPNLVYRFSPQRFIVRMILE